MDGRDGGEKEEWGVLLFHSCWVYHRAAHWGDWEGGDWEGDGVVV